MRITIADRLRPFSHYPGTSFILPGSSLRFQIFPALIRVHDLSSSEPILVAEIKVGMNGYVKDFTVMQDLEHGLIKVWGHMDMGYIRYRISALGEKNFLLTTERNPANCLLSWACAQEQEKLEEKPYRHTMMEKLSLGNNKTQDWDLIRRRLDMQEIFPLWFQLGQQILPQNVVSTSGDSHLLGQCRDLIRKRTLKAIVPAFQNLFLAGFEGGLSPRLFDDQHHGFPLPPVSGHRLSPLVLLTEGAALIRLLFVDSCDAIIHVLPALPPEFHCGRLQTACSEGKLDIEWSKKLVRRMVFTASSQATLQFLFPKEQKRFRLTHGKSSSGRPCFSESISCGSPITVEAGSLYFFDRFEK